jgi:probable F420-dependent oxidoreductase
VASGGTRGADEWRRIASRADALGYSTLVVGDHFAGMEPLVGPFSALGVVAGAIPSLRVGTVVLANDYRHPVLVAQEAVTLDILSNGRFELGMGAGWSTEDYRAAGIEHEPAGRRIARLAESLDILRPLLAGEPCRYAGEHYRVELPHGLHEPVQQPIPLLVGGGGERLLGVAARTASIISFIPTMRHGVLPQGVLRHLLPARLREKLQWVKAAAPERFDSIEFNLHLEECHVTNDPHQTAHDVGGRHALTADEVLSHPKFAIGSVQRIADDLQRRREEHWLSYYTVAASAMEQFAPVVARLAGR